MAASAAVSGFLASPPATTWIGRPLYAITGKWNLEDFIGHNVGHLCAAAAVYMCLIRLGNPETVQLFYTRWVVVPLTLLVPLAYACWNVSSAGEVDVHRFEDLQSDDPWLITYWGLFTGTGIYLLLIACRLAWRLRQLSPTRTLNMYLATFALTILFLLTLNFHVLSRFDVRTTAWTIGYTAVAMWAITPAYAWWLKSRPIGVPDSMPLVDSQSKGEFDS